MNCYLGFVKADVICQDHLQHGNYSFRGKMVQILDQINVEPPSSVLLVCSAASRRATAMLKIFFFFFVNKSVLQNYQSIQVALVAGKMSTGKNWVS